MGENVKLYVGAKVIKAEPCKAWQAFGKHPAGADGYKVYYPDGYVSWSPKETFEKAYHEVDMDYVNGK